VGKEQNETETEKASEGGLEEMRVEMGPPKNARQATGRGIFWGRSKMKRKPKKPPKEDLKR
jgi:hypothetical protein